MVLKPAILGASGKTVFVAKQYQGPFLFNSLIHNATTFQGYFDGQAGKEFQHSTTATGLARCDAMKLLECLGNTLRRFVAIFVCRVNDLCVGSGQLHTCKRQPAVTNVFAQSVAAENGEYPLEVE